MCEFEKGVAHQEGKDHVVAALFKHRHKAKEQLDGPDIDEQQHGLGAHQTAPGFENLSGGFESAGSENHRRAVEGKIKYNVPLHALYGQLQELPAHYQHEDHSHNVHKRIGENAGKDGAHQRDQFKLVR